MIGRYSKIETKTSALKGDSPKIDQKRKRLFFHFSSNFKKRKRKEKRHDSPEIEERVFLICFEKKKRRK